MGLDTLAFLLRLEEEFAVDIPDQYAEHLFTLGDIADYIVGKQQILPENRDIFLASLREVVADELSISPNLLHLDTRIDKILRLG